MPVYRLPQYVFVPTFFILLRYIMCCGPELSERFEPMTFQLRLNGRKDWIIEGVHVRWNEQTVPNLSTVITSFVVSE